MPKILVIDDEESITYTFDTFLRDEGHEVITANDYEEALAHISMTDFDLIYSDIILGGRTGIDFLREIKARGLDCPVVLITGYPNIDTASEAVRLGAFDYIPKPVMQETLLHVTNIALQHKRVIDEKEGFRLHLEAVFSSVEDAIVTVDKRLAVTAVNEAAHDICGLSSDGVGREFDSLQVRCKEKCLKALRETVEKKQSSKAYRVECQQQGQPDRILNICTYPLVDRLGAFAGAVMVVRDETRLANLENNLNERRHFHNLIGKSESMQKAYSLIQRLADVETTVLITGESGTGKELVADALHYSGMRSDKPIVKVNCAALSEGLLESELFGHVRGAFTGAVSDRIGRFQKADGGTILLDEIGDISRKVQSSLLRVIQEKAFERLGDSAPIKVDVRVIAATNKDLKEKVKRGEFREDLYYRLNVVELSLPPLRERKEDIPLLIEHFLKKFTKKLHKDIRAVSSDVERVFMEHLWPGNVRELEHALEHAFIICRHDTVCIDHLPSYLAQHTVPPLEQKQGIDAESIRLTLERTAWNKAKAARLLGVDRKTLYRHIGKHGISEDESG